MARPNNYEKKVKPYLSKIEQMALVMTEEQISETLGIGYSTWCRYKKNFGELRGALKRGRKDLVLELKSTLIQKAKGFNYIETKTVKELDEEAGDLVIVRSEENIKRALPDVAAINLLLKNYDKENWANDPQVLELRKQELELQKQKIEESNW